MKKCKTVLLATLIFAGLSIASCSKEEDTSEITAEITGQWNPIKTVYEVSGISDTDNYTQNEEGCDKDYIEFATGNDFKYIVYNRNPANECMEVEDTDASWTQTENMLTISGSQYAGTYKIMKLSDSELRIKAQQNIGGNTVTATIYFKKAAVN